MDKETRRTFNWLVSILGSFVATWTLLAWVRTTGEVVDLPVFGKIGYSKTLVFTTPVIFGILVCLYVAAFRYMRLERPPPGPERIPPAFTLSLSGPMLRLRFAVLFLFYAFPTAGLVHFTLQLFDDLRLVNRKTGSTLSGWQLLDFSPQWWDGAAWRWHTGDPNDNDFPSGFPGIQPWLYTAFAAIAVFALIAYVVAIFRKGPSATPSAPVRRPISKKASESGSRRNSNRNAP